MLIDCNGCPARGRHCDDCSMQVLLQLLDGPTATTDPAQPALDERERQVLTAWVDLGLVAPADARTAVVQTAEDGSLRSVG
ncbi:hypothetical protein G9U51_09190 [Calidifontibacter sp. DB0510]|uniref:Uncharacterized protein n=1 Tax=Metallococcus carri TaxID=1656884 RepID=A0A967B1T6_9MICO|nr:hypothetical protein [Metallococcus carri]NHN55948.1 hypothetical protein [Metallococcus carri]NOP37595.1 hypothetical protein [Calidifontibacter sp. DB2511S]